MVLRDQDRGRTVEVAVGSTVTLELSEIPTSGYRWDIESAGQLEPVGDGYAESGPLAPGAGWVRVFQFRAVRPGSHTIRLKNWREWSGEVSGRFEATVVVT